MFFAGQPVFRPVNPHKKCVRCAEWKPLAGFHRSPKTRDGRSSYCAECKREYMKIYRATCPESLVAAHRVRSLAYYHRKKKEREAAACTINS